MEQLKAEERTFKEDKHFEVIEVDEEQVFCSGEGAKGHPGVYLHMGHHGYVICPYCSCCFQKKSTPN